MASKELSILASGGIRRQEPSEVLEALGALDSLLRSQQALKRLRFQLDAKSLGLKSELHLLEEEVGP